MLRFDKGVHGLRVDVAHALFKAEGLPDAPTATASSMDCTPTRWSPTGRESTRFTTGGTASPTATSHNACWWAWSTSSPTAPLATPSPTRWTKRSTSRSSTSLGRHGVGCGRFDVGVGRGRQRQHSHMDFENHDVIRTVSRFGGGELGARRARAALLALLGFPAVAYVHQAQARAA